MSAIEIFEVETMEDMAKRLAGTGGGEQAKAVIEAIKGIRKAAGQLDAENTATALYHLAAALSNRDHATTALHNAANMADLIGTEI